MHNSLPSKPEDTAERCREEDSLCNCVCKGLLRVARGVENPLSHPLSLLLDCGVVVNRLEEFFLPLLVFDQNINEKRVCLAMHSLNEDLDRVEGLLLWILGHFVEGNCEVLEDNSVRARKEG